MAKVLILFQKNVLGYVYRFGAATRPVRFSTEDKASYSEMWTVFFRPDGGFDEGEPAAYCSEQCLIGVGRYDLCLPISLMIANLSGRHVSKLVEDEMPVRRAAGEDLLPRRMRLGLNDTTSGFVLCRLIIQDFP